MDSTNHLIRKLHLLRDSMRRAEQRVADIVLADPGKVISMRIIELANRAGVSEPTVIRFCRALEFDGFRAFKLALAQHLGSSGSFSQFRVSPTDSVADLNKKVFDTTIGSLINVRDEIDAEALEKAITALCNASRVEFYGFGASGSVAIDAQHKFFRLQVSAAAYTDPHIQHMSAISLKKDDVVVAISQSGRTKALIQTIHLAQEAGATVIGLVPDHTPIAELCDLPIYINMEEKHHDFTPVSSRIAHLVVIDVLAMGVARERGDLLKEHLKRLNKSQRSLRSGRRKPS